MFLGDILKARRFSCVCTEVGQERFRRQKDTFNFNVVISSWRDKVFDWLPLTKTLTL